jgi:hypothetical protein
LQLFLKEEKPRSGKNQDPRDFVEWMARTRKALAAAPS